ncbi:MAG: ABC transporter substrate-binding protein [SAR202 cluster bacterium]|nr:ABC transporter substrate-binding protein [SAR202 cluster bacterium]
MKSVSRFVRVPGLLGMALLAVLTLFVVACGDDETPTATTRPGVTTTPTATSAPQPTSTPTAVAKVPVQPRLRVALLVPGEQVQMAHGQSLASQKMNAQYEHLVGRDPKTNTEVPQLATRWSMAADGKTYTFDLKQNVPWYSRDGKPNGTTFNAHDIVLTWDLFNGPAGTVKTDKALTAGLWTNRLGTPENWEVVNDHKLIARFPNLNLDMVYFLSDEWEVAMMSKAHWDKTGGEAGYSADPIGTGPWVYQENKINQHFLHKRVMNHWRQTPGFEEMQFLFVPEAATRLAQLLAGEVDIIPLIRTQRQTITDAGMKTYRSTLPSTHQAIGIIYYRNQAYCPDATKAKSAGDQPCGPSKGHDPNDPMRKVEVRRALNMAVNRAEFNSVYYKGLAFPAVDYFPPWRADFKDSWTPHPGLNGRTGKDGGYPYQFDVNGAKQLLTQAGYPNGFTTTLNCLKDHRVIPEWPQMCETVVQYFRAIGVTATLEMENDFFAFRSRANLRERPNWTWSASPSPVLPCQAITFQSVWELGNGYREFEEISDYWKKCTGTTSLEERTKLDSELGTEWVNKAFSIPLFWVYAETGVNPKTVESYEVNYLNIGPVRYHEHTKPVYK